MTRGVELVRFDQTNSYRQWKRPVSVFGLCSETHLWSVETGRIDDGDKPSYPWLSVSKGNTSWRSLYIWTDWVVPMRKNMPRRSTPGCEMSAPFQKGVLAAPTLSVHPWLKHHRLGLEGKGQTLTSTRYSRETEGGVNSAQKWIHLLNNYRTQTKKKQICKHM